MQVRSIADVTYDTLKRQAPTYRGELARSTPIGEGGVGLDSIACLELLLELEDKTGLQLRDEHLTAECLATIGGLIGYLEQSQVR